MITELKNRVLLLKKNGIKSLISGLCYFLISKKNEVYEKIKFKLIKLTNRNKEYKTLINGSWMVLNLKDKGISRELSVNKIREPFSTQFIKTFISSKDTIIDIGANIGYYALLESNLVKNRNIFAIEPIPANRKILEKNIKINNYKNIKIFDCAIGDKEDEKIMYVYNKGNWCSFTKNLNCDIVNEIKVKLTTLDNFLNKHNVTPTFIRMDVEGYEYQIFKGMENLLKSKKPLKIFIELHHPNLGLMSKENAEFIIETLKKNNFKISAIILEPYPHNYKSTITINKLRKIIGLPNLGLVGKSYDLLESILNNKEIFTSMIFLERK